MRKRMSVTAIAALLAWSASGTVHAFYDDTHYVLTYYLSRSVGFTPQQAYRIASGAVAIDYSPETEPVQSIPDDLARRASLIFDDEWDANHIARVRFHAFRNQFKYPDAQTDAGQARRADLEVAERLTELELTAPVVRNPGVLMHFLQDTISHRDYGSRFGHLGNDLSPIQTEPGRPLGGTTDWLSFPLDDASARRARFDELVAQTSRALIEFMRNTKISTQSPRRAGAPPPASEWLPLLTELAQINRAPVPLGEVPEFPTRRHLVGEYLWLGRMYQAARPQFTSQVVFQATPMPDVLRQLIAAPEDVPRDMFNTPRAEARYRELWAHATGPNVLQALYAVEDHLARHGALSPRIPREPFFYDLRLDGERLVLPKAGDRSLWDQWVVYGSLDVHVPGRDRETELVVRLLPTWEGDEAQELTTEVLAPNTRVKRIERLPIGELEIEWRTGDTPVRQTFGLSRWHDSVDLAPGYVVVIIGDLVALRAAAGADAPGVVALGPFGTVDEARAAACAGRAPGTMEPYDDTTNTARFELGPYSGRFRLPNDLCP